MNTEIPKNFNISTLNSLAFEALEEVNDWCDAGDTRPDWTPDQLEALCWHSMLLVCALNEVIGYIGSQMPGLVQRLRDEYRAQYEIGGDPA